MPHLLRRVLLATSFLFTVVPFASAPAHAQPETIVASDDFDRADETPFAIGGNWGRVIAGNYDGYSLLVGNQVHSASNEGIYYWQGAGTFSATRQFARERVVLKDGELGLVLLGGPDQAIMVGWGPPGVGSTVYIYWYSNGQDRGQLATGPSSLQNGDVVEALLDNGTIYAKVNGTTVLSVANTTTLTTGRPGFITYLNPGLPSEVAILDDWQAGTPPSYSISGSITENAAGLSGVTVTASGGFAGSAVTDANGSYTIPGVTPGATSILLTPALAGHTMSPLTRTVSGPVNADVAAQDFSSTENTGAVLTVLASHGSVTRDPDLGEYPFGTDVTLTPVPDAGYTFAGWSGDVPAGHASDDPLVVTMDADRTITASFLSGNAVAADDFERANETPFTTGGNWGQAIGGSANLVSGHVAGVSGDALYYWQGAGTFDNARQYARLRVVQAGGQVGLVLLGGPGHALVVSWNAGTLYIYWYSGGSIHSPLATFPSTLHDGDLIEASLESGVVSARINGSLVASTANTTGLSGTPGFETYQSGAALDDWEAGTPQSYSISGTITENAAGLAGVLVVASGGASGTATTDANGAYTVLGIAPGATGVVLTPTLAGHAMTPLARTVAGPVNANVTGQDFTSDPVALPPGVIAFDDFERANETPFAVGGNWVQPFVAGNVNLSNHRVASVTGEALYVWQGAGTFSNTRQYARARVVQAGGQVGLVLLGGPGQALVVSWGGGRRYIYWYLGGSHHGELANDAAPLNDGDLIEAVLDDGTIYAKVNGVVVRSVPNSTSLTSGRPGFETYLSGAVFDDWEAGTPTSYAISGTITENAGGLAGVLVTATGGASGSAVTDGGGAYSISGVSPNATNVVLTPSLSGHVMSPLSRTVAGPVTADVTGQDFTSTPVVLPPGLIAADDFERANETPLVTGGDWAQPFGGGTVRLISHHAESVSGEALYYWQGAGAFDDARQFARLRVVDAGGQVGLVLLGGPGHALVVAWHDGTLYVYRYTGGSYQGNLATFPSTLQNGDEIEASLEEGVVYARINGSVVASVANTSGITSGRPGFETYQSGASFDDWEAGTPPYTTDLVAATPSPGSAISSAVACLAIPVVFTRANATPLLGYSVVVELSANLTLCGAQIASGGYPLPPRQLLVTSLGSQQWRVDEVTLGAPCGATGSGTLFTLNLSSAAGTGTGTVTIVSAVARDCTNHTIPAHPGAVASITIDHDGPATTADLVATTTRTGNATTLPTPPHGTAPIRIDFTMPGDAASVEVYRRAYGGYPQYDEAGGQAPTAPASLPAAGWTLTGVTAPGQTDDPGTRDFWSYALVTRDAYGNASAVSNLSAGALDYYLGDVSTGLATCAGDDRVNSADLSFLGSHYGQSVAVGGALECIDVGPTSDASTSGRPLTDNEIGFEDLILFGLNFGEVSAPAPPAADPGEHAGASGGLDRIALDAPETIAAGEVFDARVALHAAGRLYALSVALEWDPSVVAPLETHSGGLFEDAGGVTFSARAGALDGTLLGAGAAAIVRDGSFVRVAFRAHAAGAPRLRLGRVLARDARNAPLTIDRADQPPPAGAAVATTALLGAAPSPFVSETAIRYALAADAPVEITVYGIDGRRVRTLVRAGQTAGEHRVVWDGSDERGRAVSAGVYCVRLVAGSRTSSALVVRAGR